MKNAGGTQSRTTPSILDCAKTYTASSPVITNLRRTDDGFIAKTRPSEELAADRDRRGRSTETISSSRSSCDRLDSTWDNCNAPGTRLHSLEDTSGIQSNDCSSDAQSDAPDMPMRLCDELAIASKSPVTDQPDVSRSPHKSQVEKCKSQTQMQDDILAHATYTQYKYYSRFMRRISSIVTNFL